MWDPVDFQDNAPILEALEGRGGLLALLDEECQLQRGTDANFLTKLCDRAGRLPKAAAMLGAPPAAVLAFPRTSGDRQVCQQQDSMCGDCHRYAIYPIIPVDNCELSAAAQFLLRHYAGQVAYTVAGFREKNKDSLHPDMVGLLRNSADDFVCALFADEAAGQTYVLPQTRRTPMRTACLTHSLCRAGPHRARRSSRPSARSSRRSWAALWTRLTRRRCIMSAASNRMHANQHRISSVQWSPTSCAARCGTDRASWQSDGHSKLES